MAVDPDDAPKPIEVPASPASAQAASLVRDVSLVAASLPALLAVLGKHDVVAIVTYVTSQEFAPVLSIIATAAVIGWRQWVARRKHAEAVVMATAAPNSVATVKA